jgi:hypothetical protein
MAYVPNYTADDVAPVTIDAGTKILVQFGVFASIFGILLVVLAIVMLWKAIKRR